MTHETRIDRIVKETAAPLQHPRRGLLSGHRLLEFPLYGHAKYRVSKIKEAAALCLALHYLFKV